MNDKRWLLRPKATLGYGLALAIGIGISSATYWNTLKFIESSEWVSRTQNALDELDQVLATMDEAESATRGFVLTGDETYIESYRAAISQVDHRLERLHDLTSDNPDQQRRIALLKTSIDEKRRLLRETIEVRRAGGLEAAQAIMLSGVPRQAMRDIRNRIGEIRNQEHDQLLQRSLEWEHSATVTLALILLASGLALAFLALAVLATNRELFERRRLSLELAADRNLLRNLIDTAPDFIYIKDREGRIIRNNIAHARVMKLDDPAAAVGKTDFDFFRKDLAEIYWANDQEVIRTGKPQINREEEARNAAGETIWLSTTRSPLRDSQGEITGLVGVSRDITDRKRAEAEIKKLNDELERRVAERTGQLKEALSGLTEQIASRKLLEEQLLQSQKMEAIGQLAGGVAHDFNNLLTVISGYTDLMLMRDGLDASLRGHLGEVKRAGDQAARLTRQLLAFSRRQVMAPRVLDLNGVTASMDNMLRRLIGEDIDLVTVMDENLGRVKADPGQIESVIMNLALNAKDAMPDGGKLTLETANVELDESFAATHVGVRAGPHVMISMSDTGCGMTAEVQSHIFEPFFTTKERGRGTGLGLSTVYGIVKQSGGSIWVYSEVGCGTTFKVYLPRVDEDAEAVEAQAVQPHSKGTETVLLVEDEESLRSMVRSVLESAGYEVLEAGGGSEAVSLCISHDRPIHLLLTDVVMPQMSGKEVSDRVIDAHPETKVLYMSGYTDKGIVHNGVLESGAAFLQKPFTPTALTRKIREVLDGTSA